jgi:hypothetical protein
VCDDLPWTKSNILDFSSLAHYRPGDIGFTSWDQPPHVKEALRFRYPLLAAEYRHALLAHPLLLAEIKLRAWVTLLGLDRTEYFAHTTIVDNPYGLGFGPRLEPARQWLTRICLGVTEQPTRWISGVHLVWLLANVVLVLAGLLRGRRGDRRAGWLALVLLVPLFYALSYLAATPVHDFRFLYPATLVVQGVVLALGGGALLQNPTGRAPKRAMLAA